MAAADRRPRTRSNHTPAVAGIHLQPELETKVREVCTIKEKAHTTTFSVYHSVFIMCDKSQQDDFSWSFDLTEYHEYHNVLNVKAVVVATFNHKKALVGAFSVIVQTLRTFFSSSTENGRICVSYE